MLPESLTPGISPVARRNQSSATPPIGSGHPGKISGVVNQTGTPFETTSNENDVDDEHPTDSAIASIFS